MKIKISAKKPGEPEQVAIKTEFIKLDSFLKLVNIVESGGDAKLAIQDGEVSVNGEVCTMRGKKLRPGDKVKLGSDVFVIIGAQE